MAFPNTHFYRYRGRSFPTPAFLPRAGISPFFFVAPASAYVMAPGEKQQRSPVRSEGQTFLEGRQEQ